MAFNRFTYLPLFAPENEGGGTPTAANTPAPAADPPASGKQDTVANLRAELAAERVSKRSLEEQIAARDAKLVEAEAARTKAAQDATAPLVEKLTKRDARLIDAEMRAAAAAAGLGDPDLLGHSFFDRSQVKVDDEGNVTGVAELFEAVKTKKPDWFKPVSTGAAGGQSKPATGGATPPAGGGGTTPPANVRALSKDDYDKQKKDFLRSLRK